MITFEELKKKVVVDEWGNTHFLVDYLGTPQLVASFFPQIAARIAVYPEPDTNGHVRVVEKVWPLAAVYLEPREWTGEKSTNVTFPILGDFAHCAINGLLFYADLVKMISYENVTVASAHTSEYDGGDERHQLAKEIILGMTRKPWNEQLLIQEDEQLLKEILGDD